MYFLQHGRVITTDRNAKTTKTAVTVVSSNTPFAPRYNVGADLEMSF